MDAPFTVTNKFEEGKVKLNGLDFRYIDIKASQNADFKGTIVVVHGFADWSEMYTKIADKWADQGYDVFIFDQRGAGLTSMGKSRGITNDAHTFSDLEAILEIQIEKLAQKKSKNLFLFGHSMGGAISLNYSVRGKYKDNLTGIFVTGPCIKLTKKSSPNALVYHAVPYVAKILPNARFLQPFPYEFLSHDTKTLEYFFNSEKCGPYGSVGLFYGMFLRAQNLLTQTFVSQMKKDLPILILHGTDDAVCDIQGSKEFAKLLKIDDFKLVEIPGALHCLQLESSEYFDKAVTESISWLNDHAK